MPVRASGTSLPGPAQDRRISTAGVRPRDSARSSSSPCCAACGSARVRSPAAAGATSHPAASEASSPGGRRRRARLRSSSHTARSTRPALSAHPAAAAAHRRQRQHLRRGGRRQHRQLPLRTQAFERPGGTRDGSSIRQRRRQVTFELAAGTAPSTPATIVRASTGRGPRFRGSRQLLIELPEQVQLQPRARRRDVQQAGGLILFALLLQPAHIAAQRRGPVAAAGGTATINRSLPRVPRGRSSHCSSWRSARRRRRPSPGRIT